MSGNSSFNNPPIPDAASLAAFAAARPASPAAPAAPLAALPTAPAAPLAAFAAARPALPAAPAAPLAALPTTPAAPLAASPTDPTAALPAPVTLPSKFPKPSWLVSAEGIAPPRWLFCCPRKLPSPTASSAFDLMCFPMTPRTIGAAIDMSLPMMLPSNPMNLPMMPMIPPRLLPKTISRIPPPCFWKCSCCWAPPPRMSPSLSRIPSSWS